MILDIIKNCIMIGCCRGSIKKLDGELEYEIILNNIDDIEKFMEIAIKYI